MTALSTWPEVLGSLVARTDLALEQTERAMGEILAEPLDYGLARATTADLRGGDAAHNAEVVRRLLAGEKGPVRDAVVLNAGAGLAVYDDGLGSFHERLAAGIERAVAAIDSDAAAATLERWVAASGR